MANADYRNMLFLVGFFVLGILLVILEVLLDSKLTKSKCVNKKILWCNRLILIISLMIVGTTVVSIVFNAVGIDNELGILNTGKFYGAYGIVLLILGIVLLTLSSIMLEEHIRLNKPESGRPGTGTVSGGTLCDGKNEMIGLILTSVLFMGLGVGMSVIGFTLKKSKTKSKGNYGYFGGKKKGGKVTSICKTPGTVYLDPEKDLNKNVNERFGKKIKYRKGSCEERYPCYDWKRMACYSIEGELDNSYKEATEIRDLTKPEGEGNKKSVNRIVKKLRDECNSVKGQRWDNNKKDDYREACIKDGYSKMKREFNSIYFRKGTDGNRANNFKSAPLEKREEFRDKWYVDDKTLDKLRDEAVPRDMNMKPLEVPLEF